MEELQVKGAPAQSMVLVDSDLERLRAAVAMAMQAVK